MAIDWFGKNKREEALKTALRNEIEEMINSQKAESNANLQDWDSHDQSKGKNPKISYKSFELIYKRESWVRACIDAIARASTSNGFRLVTVDPNDPRPLMRRETRKIMDLLVTPNPDDSFSDIIYEIIVDLHLYGDAYVEIVKDENGKPVSMYNIYAPSMKVLVNKHGTVLGYVQDTNSQFGGRTQKPIVFDSTEMVHFRLPNPGNAVYGLSPLESLALPIETDLHAQNYNLNFFKNNATPKLHVDLGNCTLAQLKRTREFFKHQFQGSNNAHKTLITEGGVKVNAISLKPADMEFLNQRKFSRDEICAVFGVPPMKIGIFEDVNRASATESDKAFKGEKVVPLQRMIARKLNLSVIKLFDQRRVKLEFSELDLTDAKEQAEIDKIDIESGARTINEVRRSRGLPPIEEKEEPKEEVKPEPNTEPKVEETVEDNKDFDYEVAKNLTIK